MSESVMQEQTTEHLPELPKGWVWTTLGNIRSDLSKSISPKKSPDQSFELYSVPSFDSDEPEILLGKEIGSSKRLVEENTVLLCKINPRINRVWIVGSKSPYPKIASTEWIPFSKSESINPDYLRYFMCNSQFREFLNANVSGVGGSLMRTRASVLDNYPFPLPPFREQGRIVEKIEELFTRLDAGIDSLKKVQAQLRRYRQSTLKAAVEGKLTEEWREAHKGELEPASVLLERILKERREKWEAEQLEMFDAKGKVPKDGKWKGRYPEPMLPDKTQLPRLPEEWVWATMDSITVQGPQNGLYLPQSKYGQGVPILRIDDYQDGWSKISGELKLVDATPAQKEKYRLSIGDLVINRVNSMTHLGKCIVIAERNLPSLFESNMMKLCVAEIMGPSYVEFYLRSVLGRSQLTKNAKWAVNQASINQKDVLRTPVPLPPLDEQKLIVEEISRCLSVADEIESAIQSELKRAERLRQSILKQAFSGKLAPQDPSDEPAAVLLERIKAEKAKREKPAKRAKEPEQMKLF